MLNPDLREVLGEDISRYSLVIATAKRAREIAEEAEAKGDIIVEKPVTLAVNEFLDGKYCIEKIESTDED